MELQQEHYMFHFHIGQQSWQIGDKIHKAIIGRNNLETDRIFLFRKATSIVRLLDDWGKIYSEDGGDLGGHKFIQNLQRSKQLRRFEFIHWALNGKKKMDKVWTKVNVVAFWNQNCWAMIFVFDLLENWNFKFWFTLLE